MESIKSNLKQLIISSLNLEDLSPDDIKDEDALFGEGLGLDSIDALELGIAIQKKFDVKLNTKKEDIKQYFYSINTLTELINELSNNKEVQ